MVYTLTQNKIQRTTTWPTPTTIKKLRGFLGLTCYYCHFVQHFGLIAAPLKDLLKKNAFCWNSDAQAAFEELKPTMSTTPVSAIPDFSLLFILKTDASDSGLRAVLMQSGRPIAYYSHSLSSRKRQCSIYERELMAIVFALQKWHHYLLGRPFIIRTDQ